MEVTVQEAPANVRVTARTHARPAAFPPPAERPEPTHVLVRGADGVVDRCAIGSLIVKPPIGKWKEYANDAWFSEQESTCETVLEEFLSKT